VTAAEPPGAGLRRARGRRGALSFLGFMSSMALLAAASLVMIPALIDSAGAHAWGRIAAGQSVGAIAAVVVAFGWGLAGPARIARADAEGRRREYRESMIAKLVIVLPMAALAAGASWLLGGDHRGLAVLGALTACSIGLTTNWVFVGLGRPWVLLVWETLPRAGGTALGIALMSWGAGAAAGLLAQLAGMLVAFVACSVWILAPRAASARSSIPRRGLRQVLREQGHGVTSSIVSAGYASAPVILVGLLVPLVLPAYALLDKVQRQINAAAASYVTVLQGWVPRGEGRELQRRVKLALVVSAIGCALLALVLALVAPWLLTWLARGEILPPRTAMVLMAVVVAVNLMESVTSRACLAALGRIDVVARATAVGSAVGVLLLVAGVLLWGVVGALTGVLAGLTLRLAIEVLALRGSRRHSRQPAPVIDQPTGVA